MKTKILLAALAAASFLAMPSRAEDAALRVCAASSLADVLKEINAAFETSTGTKVELNLGASSTLARQIEEGAPADVFFSADLAKMDGLEKQGLIDSSTKKAKLSNSLVVVIPADSKLTITSGKDLASMKQIALANPMAVPAGIYAKTWLEKIGLWLDVQPRVVATENVRAALAAVESGNADAGVVYKTDAAISKAVKIAYEVPAADAPRITYPIAVLKNSKNASTAKLYLDFLDNRIATQAIRKFGFVVLPDSPPAAK